MRTFGCVAYAHIPDTERKKLDKKAVKLRFVGYATNAKGYRLWDEVKRRMLIRRDVVFNETDFGCKRDEKNSSENEWRVTPSLKTQLAVWPGPLSPLPRAPLLQISQEGHPPLERVKKRFGFCREFGCSKIETLSCSWDKSGTHTGSPPPPTGRECVPFTGRLAPRVVHTRAATLKGSRCSVHVCPALGTLERAHVWPPGSEHAAVACTSASAPA
uniref:Retroviral polymerase SH3-like domain-containing protein n=1 Tax=Knipowitschia caucasica TaxID=637954 RepID=A0AAV2MQC8_KNICA